MTPRKTGMSWERSFGRWRERGLGRCGKVVDILAVVGARISFFAGAEDNLDEKDGDGKGDE